MTDTNAHAQSIDESNGFTFPLRLPSVLAELLFAAGVAFVAMGRETSVVTTVFSAAGLCLLFSFLPMFKNFKAFGINAELRDHEAKIRGITEEQQAQKKDIDLIQRIAFAGIISKFEEKHLRGLAEPGTYPVRYSQALKEELSRMDRFGFLLPNQGKGLNSIDEQYGKDLHIYEATKKTEFDLKDFVHITAFGTDYINLAKSIPDLPVRQ
jgi:hypothetical protein